MYKCYSTNLMKFLVSKGNVPAHKEKHKVTNKTAWLFYQTKKFKKDLNEYHQNTIKMKKFA